jgi:hypothetical protein
MPEKFRDRILFVKDYKELSDIVDVHNLPKPLGGKLDESNYISESLKMVESTLEIMQRTQKFEIDWTKVEKKGDESSEKEIFGSFRKLEID